MPTARRLLLTCEHGGNRVPAAYARLFRGQQDLLESHAGVDIGALAAARSLRDHLAVPLIASTTTRLLVDLNRSPRHPRLFSVFTRDLRIEARTRILARYYTPYRTEVESWVAARAATGQAVVQVSVHSFVPWLNGQRRDCDIGLLYDPARPAEASFCREWQQRLQLAAPALKVRRNYPYRGVADGLVTWLRRRYSNRRYAGIELEINQSLPERGGAAWRDLQRLLAVTMPVRSGD